VLCLLGVCVVDRLGFFLVLAQPFRLGDKVAVSCTALGAAAQPAAAAAAAVQTPAGVAAAAAAGSSYGPRQGAAGGSGAGAAASSTPPGWFEGICEKVDLRYTVLR
jgi:hypothetical protein